MASGETLQSICRDDHMPHAHTVRTWVIRGDPEFLELYTRARQAQAWKWSEDIIEISDDISKDYCQDETGNWRPDHDHINRAKLRVESRRWFVSRVLPRIFGDNVSHEHTGQGGGPIQLAAAPFDASRLSLEERQQLRALLVKARDSNGSQD
jgi:hypothetical protein